MRVCWLSERDAFVRNCLAVAHLHAKATCLDPLCITFKDLVRTAQKTYCSSQIMQFRNSAATKNVGDCEIVTVRNVEWCQVRTVECYREQS